MNAPRYSLGIDRARDLPDEIGTLQWRRLVQLGNVHGLGWANWAAGLWIADALYIAARTVEAARAVTMTPIDVPLTWSAAVEAFQLARAARDPALPSCEVVPWPEYAADDGRIRWAVWHDGRAVIDVHRPDPRAAGGLALALRASVGPDGAVRLSQYGDQINAHHVAALARCLDAIADVNAPATCEKCDGTGWAGAPSGVTHGGISEMIGEPCPDNCPDPHEAAPC